MDTYANMKTEVESWLNREGFASLTSKVDTFLGMAQRRIFRDCDLRCLEATATNTTGTSLTVPADYMRTKAFYIIVGSEPVEVRGSSFHDVLRQRITGAGQPKVYDLVGDTIYLGPEAVQDYTWHLVYYKSLALLSGSNTTNWFTDNAPELVLFSSLLEASIWLKDDNRANVWKQRYEEVKESVEQNDIRADKESGSLQVRNLG